jgi:branched-chain amino acid aminotransferase
MTTPAIPFHDRTGWIWMDGAFVPWQDAKVHLCTHAMHYASSVFEGERAYGGRIFKSALHTRRLIRSAEILGFTIPFSFEEIERAKVEAMARNGLETCYLRPIAWRGSEQLGVSAQNNTIHLAVAVWDWGSYFADRMKGIRLTMAPWRRPAPDSAPFESKAAGLYMICTLSKHAAEAAGYQDAMMLDYRGRIAEATGANVFFIRDGEIHTPDPDCFLNGITRQTVIGLARARGIVVHERPIWPDELGSFTECFLTGSAAEITPVSEIAGHIYKPAAMTEQLIADFTATTTAAPAVAA